MKKININTRRSIVELYNNGNSIQKVSELLDIGIDSVKKYLKKADITIRSNVKYSINEQFFSDINNEFNAYWLGFVMADGYVAQIRKKKSYKNGTSLHSRMYVRLKEDDHLHLQKMVKDMNSTHPVKFRKQNRDGKVFQVCSVEIHNKQLVSDLIKLGCVQGKSLILQYPNIPYDLERHFLRGYFDGDGTIFKRNGIVEAKFCSGSKSFIESIKDVLTRNKIQTNKIGKGDGVWIMSIKKDNVQSFLNFLYPDASTYLDRKYKLASEAINASC